MDTEHTMCPEVTPADTVVDQSAESLLTDSISAEEMTALKAYFERFAQEVLSSSRCKLNPGDDLPHYLFRKLENQKHYFPVWSFRGNVIFRYFIRLFRSISFI